MSLLVDLDKVSFIAIYSSIHILLFSKSQLCAQQHMEKILKYWISATGENLLWIDIS